MKLSSIKSKIPQKAPLNGQLSGGTLSWVGNPDDWVAFPSCVYAHHVLNLAFLQNPKFSSIFFTLISGGWRSLCGLGERQLCLVVRGCPLVVLINNYQSSRLVQVVNTIYPFYSSLCNVYIVKPH